MTLDAKAGVFLDEEHAEYGEQLVREINELLQRANLLLHQEPRSWDEIFAKHPNKKPKKRNLGERLGFYSSSKYGDLQTLAHHLATYRRPPSEWPAVSCPEKKTAQAPPISFEHCLAVLCMGAVLLPLAFSELIEAPSTTRGEVCRLASAPRVLEECEIILTACGAFDTGDPNDDWKNAVRDAKLEALGIQRGALADPWVTLGEPLGLCLRLIRVAEGVLWSGSFSITG